MSDQFPQKFNSSLIQKRGREIVLKLKEDMDRSEIVLIGEDSRKQILKRAKSLVDGDRSGLSGVEKGILLQYVLDGITGNVDPDSRLNLLLKTNVKAPQHSETRQEQLKELNAKLENIPDNFQQARRRGRLFGFVLAILLITGGVTLSLLKNQARKSLHQFVTPTDISLKKNDQIDYQLTLEGRSYYVYLPKNYDGKEPYGLIVYTSPADDFTQLPPGWSNILDARHFILIAPQDAGNQREQEKRSGLGVLGALAAMKEYKIDPSRVYAAGLSGGARTAGDMAFYQSDLFKGTIQDCGADFYKGVPHVNGSNWTDSNGNDYGIIDVSPEDVRNAKANVKFAIITGPGDFRHGNLSDLYQGGFRADGFKCKFIDVPKMGHQDCSAETLGQAIDFLSTK